MDNTMDFWIALSSPSSYLASLRVDDIGAKHGRVVRWRPFNIRKALEVEGIKPNVLYPRKGEYTRRDWERTARLHGHRYKLPEPFGRSSLPATVVAYWAESRQGQEALKTFCRCVMAAYFVDNRPIDDPDVLARIAEGSGLDPTGARNAIDDPHAMAAVDEATQAALDAGVWGAPFVIVDGELFWGEDRLDQLDLWLHRGGW